MSSKYGTQCMILPLLMLYLAQVILLVFFWVHRPPSSSLLMTGAKIDQIQLIRLCLEIELLAFLIINNLSAFTIIVLRIVVQNVISVIYQL